MFSRLSPAWFVMLLALIAYRREPEVARQPRTAARAGAPTDAARHPVGTPLAPRLPGQARSPHR
jgi:hypothetical protein